MSYPEAVNLPFNTAALGDDFTPLKPGAPEPSGEGYWAVIQGGGLVVGDGRCGLFLPEGERPSWLDAGTELICIGLWLGKPLRAAFLGTGVKLPAPFVAEPFNAITDRLDDRLLTLGGLAHQVLQWEKLSAVCARCGGGLERIDGTWGKRCRSCRHEHFPHIHPCIIVLVRRGDDFLLARKGSWPPGRYSLIAGFLDFGESLEETVHREVEEEAGIRVTNLRYVGSQNWPFPSQLMAGFVADYAGGEVRVDGEEIEDARWFRSDRLPDSLPGKRSIARWIIDRYALAIDETESGAGSPSGRVS
jgi:NAD+ diphosphatase